MLTKEQILEVDDLVTEVVAVPEWGGDVLVRTLPGYDRDRFEQQVVGLGSGEIVENLRARLVAKCLVDDEGNLLFEESDVVLLGKKSSKALDAVFAVCQRLCGLREEDVKELEKNSPKTQTGDSILD